MNFATVKPITTIKPTWKILPKYDVSRGVGYSQVADFVVILETCVVVIEAKNYCGKIIADGYPTNSQWFCQTEDQTIKIDSCWGENPYQQCDRYTKSVWKLLQTYPPCDVTLWQSLKDSVSLSLKSLLDQHGTLLDFNGNTATIGLRNPNLANIANQNKNQLIEAFQSLYPNQPIQIAIAHINLSQIMSPKIPTYGAIVFPQGSNISQIGNSNHPRIREIGEFYRVTTMDNVRSLLEALEIEATYRTNNRRFSPNQISDLLCGRSIYPIAA